jgi:hypothetical protein
MPDNLRVYISSTFADLRVYRAAVTSVLRRFDFSTITLDEFGATDESPFDVAETALAQADIIIQLIAYRYGYVPLNGDKSITEWEYDKATSLKKPIFVFLLDEDNPWPVDQIELNNFDRLKAFKNRIKQERVVSFFTTPEDLAAKVAVAVSQYSRRVEGIPTEPPPTVITEEPVKISLVNVMEELKAVRTEISILQQVMADTSHLAKERSTTNYEGAEIRPADFLGVPAVSIKQEKCFVIMPYSERWSSAVERIILEVCSEVDFEFSIAKNMEGRFIPNDIWRGITGAGVIIADLSGANPNVTYEIGLADVLGKDVIIICQSREVPFDFLGQRMIIYEDSLSGTLTLREELTTRLRRIKADFEQGREDSSRS